MPTDEELLGLAGILFMFFVVVFVILLLSAIFTMAGNYKVFKKMNKPGWKGLIPFYAGYIKFKEVWEEKYFWFYFASTIFVMLSGQLKVNGILDAIATILSLISLVLTIIMNVKLAERFNKSAGFGIGLTLLTPIFYMILGSSQDEYQQPITQEDYYI